jgi:hypothetical protein
MWGRFLQSSLQCSFLDGPYMRTHQIGVSFAPSVRTDLKASTPPSLRSVGRNLTLAAVVTAALTFAWGPAAHADTPVITADTTTLLANSPSQTIQLTVSGTNWVLGEALNFQINDGGSGPVITGVDILTGTIFAASNNGQNYPLSGGFNNQGIYTAGGTLSGHIAVVMTTTHNGDIATTNGLLATLTISTVGFLPGDSFQLNMIETLNGPSVFGTGGSLTLGLAFPNHTFTLVPEPASLALLAFGIAPLLFRNAKRQPAARR